MKFCVLLHNALHRVCHVYVDNRASLDAFLDTLSSDWVASVDEITGTVYSDFKNCSHTTFIQSIGKTNRQLDHCS